MCSLNYYCEDCFQSTYPKYELNPQTIWIDVNGQRSMWAFWLWEQTVSDGWGAKPRTDAFRCPRRVWSTHRPRRVDLQLGIAAYPERVFPIFSIRRLSTGLLKYRWDLSYTSWFIFWISRCLAVATNSSGPESYYRDSLQMRFPMKSSICYWMDE